MAEKVIYPIGIDFSGLHDMLKPLYELQNQTQELIIDLRNTRESIKSFENFSFRLETMIDRQDRNEKKIVTILNRLDKLFDLEKSFEPRNTSEEM